ncbi:MAG: FAD-binding protein [Bacteroidales bacterium]|nr:FAD-binding protein [Bacteroidales bacterium]
MSITETNLENLAGHLEGELMWDRVAKALYSTDASMYRESPAAVAIPRHRKDLKKLLAFASEQNVPLIMRGAGTSLAGQVVGKGIVVDISKYMNRIIEINPRERWIRVEPGVILEDLNRAVAEHGLFFAPETSTANRCTIAGMAGNNACGLHSLRYGSTREHTLEIEALLSDGTEVTFTEMTGEEIEEISRQNTLEGKIYNSIVSILRNPGNRRDIINEYPERSVKRRNTGYALDLLLDMDPFTPGGPPFNLSKMITGSEGTLVIITSLKLNLMPLPPKSKALCCVHLENRNEAFRANLIALKYDPDAVEMMDDKILQLTKDNLEQSRNRFFVEGDPGALLIVEFCRDTEEEIKTLCASMTDELRREGYGYAFPVIRGSDIARVWNLRKSGLGVLSNMKGDARPVSLIEDTTVSVNLLPDYMKDFESMLATYGKECVYHAHIGTGELHLRPVLNLKDTDDVAIFRKMATDTALLVKKYRGSLSGEHGDGRLRGEFIPIMLGKNVYSLLEDVKKVFDPHSVLNPGKITATPPMDTFLRYTPGKKTADVETIFDFSGTGGFIRAIEKCNGSGDCLKSHLSGGTMCPSYMATRDEKNSTRARANALREFIGNGNGADWNSREIYEILDLCLSCKGCKSECPSSVDITRLKAEYMQHWYDKHHIPLRSWFIANISFFNRLGSIFPPLFNLFVTNRYISGMVKYLLGFARQRRIPVIYSHTLRRWAKKNLPEINPEKPLGELLYFADEFTNYNDTMVGIKAIKLLTALGYRVIIPDHTLSGRAYFSKGLLRRGKSLADKNISLLSNLVTRERPLVGTEPSAILSFRDEYPDLAVAEQKEAALTLASNTLLIEEFICREHREGKITADSFTDKKREILLHGHCQQKAITGVASTIEMLSIPANYTIKEIKSGCCGMAGSFGYEKEHYDLSMKIGELILFPEVRSAGNEITVAAPGTSCRHQIMDGTGRTALHPAEILFEALKNPADN